MNLRKLPPFTLCAASLMMTYSASAENLLLGKGYRFWTPPNYVYTTGATDLSDLTDGKLARGPEIWRDQATVGWKVRDGAPMIQFNLGEAMFIERLRFHTVAGRAGTTWPTAMHLYGSNDGANWAYLGDAMDGIREQLPKVEGEQEGTVQKEAVLHWIESKPLGLKKAYQHIVLAVESSFFVFCDEVEMIAASTKPEEDSGSTAPLLSGEKEVREHLSGLILTRSIRRRLQDDAAAIAALAKQKNSPPSITEKLEAIGQQIAEMPVVSPKSFTNTTFPLHPLHEKLFALQAEVWQAAATKGEAEAPAVLIWPGHRFDSLPVVHAPEEGAPVALRGELLNGSRWGSAFWISNRGSEPMQIGITQKTEALASIGELAVSHSSWHDTKDGIPVHSLLEPLASGATFTLAPGMSCRVWIGFKASAPGNAAGELLVTADEKEIAALPLQLTVHSQQQPAQKLAVVLWDYLDQGGLYGLNKANSAAARALVDERFQYAPWASSRVAPKPAANAFDENHQMVTPARFPGLQQWVDEVVPGRPLYGIFLIGTPEFAGKKLGEAGYEERITAWIKELAKHLESIGADPSKFILAAVDEPHSEGEDRLSLAWTRAIKAAEPRFRVMVNPTYARPDRVRNQASIAEGDIIMPRSNLYQQEGEIVGRYFEALRKNGRSLWLYSCEGARPVDASEFYRKMGWLAWARQAEGIGFWALGDAGGGSSWNEYDASLPTGTPIFLSSTRAANAMELEALAEGIHEHALLMQIEEAAMLDTAPEAWKKEATELLTEIRAEMGPVLYQRPPTRGADRLEGWASADARRLDQWRDRMIALLVKKP